MLNKPPVEHMCNNEKWDGGYPCLDMSKKSYMSILASTISVLSKPPSMVPCPSSKTNSLSTVSVYWNIFLNLTQRLTWPSGPTAWKTPLPDVFPPRASVASKDEKTKLGDVEAKGDGSLADAKYAPMEDSVFMVERDLLNDEKAGSDIIFD